MKNNSIKKFTYLALLAAMAITINLFESTYLAFLPFGIRFGLANIIALVTLEMFSIKEMLLINVLRVLIGSLLRGTIFGTQFFISLGGVLLSSITLILIRKILKFPIYSTSILSAVAHSFGQVLVVIMIYNQASMVTIFPYLLISSIPTGLLTGMVANGSLKRLKFKQDF